jgi:hypothetical protein
VNISRPYTDVADWSVFDPLRTSGVQCTSNPIASTTAGVPH